MKNKLLVVIGILLVFSLACSFLQPKTTPPPEETVQDGMKDKGDQEDEVDKPTDDGDGGEDQTSDEDDVPLNLDREAFDQLDYYRSKIEMRYESGDDKVQESVIESAYIREPSAQHLIMESNNEEGIEMIQIGDQMWVRFGEEWMQTSAVDGEDIANSFSDFLMDGDDINLIQDSDYQFIGSENVNGVKTRHYRAKYTQPWMMGFLDGDDELDVKEGLVNFWVADESDLPSFVVKMELKMEGVANEQNTLFTLTQNVTDINKPFTIEAPSQDVVGGLPDSVPLYPGATGITTIGGMTLFSSEDSVVEVAEFYFEALEEEGWEQKEKMDMENLMTSSWVKGGEKIQLTISVGDDDSGSSIMIVAGDE